MARMTRPYEDDRAERIAIVDALLLLEWVAYTTPPRKRTLGADPQTVPGLD